MNKKIFKGNLRLFSITILISVQACNVVQNTANAPVATSTPIETASSATLSVPAVAQSSPAPNVTPTLSSPATQTPAQVMVTAVKGNLFIRRGPDLAFNPVSALLDGQSADALARDVLAKWVQIPIPGEPGKTGWISVQTSFSKVDGDVMSLPEVMPTDWPVLAYLRNCTSHQMEVKPIGLIIPAVSYFPDNVMQINPGLYTIHDNDVTGNPEVMSVEIREGSQIDIRVDGTGLHKKCPTP